MIPLVYGIRYLVSRGKPVNQREGEPQLLAIEKTGALVTTGIDQYIRHHFYSSLLFFTGGIFFKAPVWLSLMPALAATLCLVATARAYEAECLRFFGSDYQVYMKQSKMFGSFVL